MFSCPPQPQLSITPAIDIPPSRPSSKDVPELSASVESAASEPSGDTPTAATSKPQQIPQSNSRREDSALSRSRGKEKHLTPLGLKRIVGSIQERRDLEPLSPKLEASLSKIVNSPPEKEGTSVEKLKKSTDSGFSTATLQTEGTARQSDHRGSDTSVESDGLIRSGSVVHGFSPSQLPPSFRAKSKLAPNSALAISRTPQQLVPKKAGIFTLGGSSGDDESSFEERMSYKPQRSRLSESLQKPLEPQKKHPSFKDIVQARQAETKEHSDQDEDAIESDDDEITDSAIEEDEDEAEWEDDVSVDGRQLADDPTLFMRVDSRPDLVSRRSMLTLALHNPNPPAPTVFANAASRSSPAIRRSRAGSPTGPSPTESPRENEDDSGLTMHTAQGSRPLPIIQTTTNTHAPAHSPRTTRRNMLATELTESLRRNLLWERQQKSTTANAVYKRRNTAQSMANLQEYPANTGQGLQEAAKNNSWNHYFDTPWEYHTKGW